MKFSQIIFALIFPCLTILSMDQENQIRRINPCFLATLPRDIRNTIATYVSSLETDEAFISRAQKISMGIPNRPIEYGNSKITCTKENGWFSTKITLSAHNLKSGQEKILIQSKAPRTNGIDLIEFSCSPDCSKVVLMERKANYQPNATRIMIFRISGPLLHWYDNEDDVKYSCPAISSHGKLVALINNIPFIFNGKVIGTCPGSIIVYNIITKDKMVFTLTSKYNTGINALAFNKQGTKVIVCGNNGYDIFQIQNEQPDRLLEYFKQRGICKQWPTQL